MPNRDRERFSEEEWRGYTAQVLRKLFSGDPILGKIETIVVFSDKISIGVKKSESSEGHYELHVSRGFIDFLDEEVQYEENLAHEFAHIKLQHKPTGTHIPRSTSGFRGYAPPGMTPLWPDFPPGVYDPADPEGISAGVVWEPFEDFDLLRKQETEADAVAVQKFLDEKRDCSAYYRFMRKLADKEEWETSQDPFKRIHAARLRIVEGKCAPKPISNN